MALQGVAFGYSGMIEIVFGRVRHAELFHHAPRAEISDRSEGDQFRQGQAGKCEVRHGLRRFGGKAPPPSGAGEPPADFDARGERGRKARDREAREPEEVSRGFRFDGVEAPTALLKPGGDAAGEAIAFRAAEAGWKEFHDLGIGVHGGEGREVFLQPIPEDQATGFEHLDVRRIISRFLCPCG